MRVCDGSKSWLGLKVTEGLVCMKYVKTVSSMNRYKDWGNTSGEIWSRAKLIYIYVAHFNSLFEVVISIGDKWYDFHTPFGESHVAHNFADKYGNYQLIWQLTSINP